MTKRVHPGSTATYEAAERWVDAALRRSDSLFTPGTAVWASPVVEDLWHRFVNQPDQSRNSFEVKLSGQLTGAPDHTIQLMAEVIYVHFLVAADMKAATKRNLVSLVLGWMRAPVNVPDYLEPAFSSGIANSGTAFKTYRPFQLFYLVNFVKEWKSLGAPQTERALADAWIFKEIADSVPVRAAQSQRSALLHLVHPEVFEPTVSQHHKKLIVKAFGSLLDELPDDDDRALYEIRRLLTPKYGEDFNFYAPEIKSVWDKKAVVESDPQAWDEFIFWARKWREWARFDEEERAYKIAIAQKLNDAREALFANGDWKTLLLDVVAGSANNLLHFTTKDNFKTALAADPAAFERGLRRMWHFNQEGPAGRLGGFWHEIRPVLGKTADRRALGFFLLGGIDVYRFPPYKQTAFLAAYDLTKWPAPAPTSKAANLYRHGLTFLDRIVEEAAARGLQLRDRLDAQSVLWCITKWPEGERPEGWSDSDWHDLLRYRAPGEDGGSGAADPGPAAEPSVLTDLANELFLDEDFFVRIQDLLGDKKQLVFYGAPGTGKTHVARRVASQLAGAPERVRLVQFHPSYSYEDFVEGYRPREVNGLPGFVLTDGPLKAMAAAAAAAPALPHVLVIDELNRGNVAKVFGELYFLLEYRDEEIVLQYSNTPFRVPPNLFFLCTMNTVDRSIALVDAALRRRFHFLGFFPQEWPVRGLLARWLAHHNPELEWVARALERVNARLDRNAAIGPSHFIRPDLSEDMVALIWEHSVMPYLEEVYFDDPERVQEFALESVLAEPDSSLVDSVADAPSDTD